MILLKREAIGDLWYLQRWMRAADTFKNRSTVSGFSHSTDKLIITERRRAEGGGGGVTILLSF